MGFLQASESSKKKGRATVVHISKRGSAAKILLPKKIPGQFFT